MDDLHIKQTEIEHARAIKASSSVIGEYHHQLVGEFVNNLSLSRKLQSPKLLEIGCGKGTLRKYITSSYFGIDPIQLPECKEFQFKQCCGQKIPFENHFFDIIVIKDAINYHSDLNELLSEITRSVIPNGLVIFTEFVGKNYSLPRFLLKKFIKFQIGLMKNSWDNSYLATTRTRIS